MSASKSEKPGRPLRSSGWRMSTLIRISLLVHAAALACLLLAPGHWPEILGVLALNHGVLTLCGLLPRSRWLGPNWTKLPPSCVRRKEIALTIDDGPDPWVTPKVLALLDEHRVKATFFCIGQQAARHPELCREIVARGHAVENHSQHHPHTFSLWGRRSILHEIESAQRTLTSITGQRPQFFRAPAGLRNPFLDPALHQAELQLASWTRRGFDTRTRAPATVAARLLKNLEAGDILLLHDGNSALTAAGNPVILDVLPLLLKAAAQSGLTFVTLPAALQSPP